MAALLLTLAGLLVSMQPVAAQESDSAPSLLTDPYLQLPTESSVQVAWVTEFPGAAHIVLSGELVRRLPDAAIERLSGQGLAGLGEAELERALISSADAAQGRGLAAARANGRLPLRVAIAETAKLSRVREDASSRVPGETYTAVVARDLWRHEATVDGLEQGERVPYRVLSVGTDGSLALSDTFTLAPLPQPGTAQQILLTSDHQLMPLTPANLQKVEETVGQVDAVFLAGDLVNIPDRASEWFDDTNGGAFFPALQGNAQRAVEREETTTVYTGGELIQHAPLYTSLGNHEVMGRVDAGTLGEQFNSPLPREVAEGAYEAVAEDVNPSGDPAVRERWITDHSFNADTYRELFTLPQSDTGGETYWATTFGDVRLVSLYATRIWRTPAWDSDRTGAFREASETYDDPYEQGWGRHIFEPIAEGSAQYEWLAGELQSEEFRDAEIRIVMLHHPLHTLGDNINPPFTDPQRFVERDENDDISFIRYEYPKDDDYLIRDVEPLLQEAGVDLVHNGHSHVWNRFRDATGVDFLETSNVGNTYNAYTEDSGRARTVPPSPWNSSNYTATGDPYGLDPIVPTDNPLLAEDGSPLPYVASNDHTVFSILDTGTGVVTSYGFDVRQPNSEVFILDRFSITD